MKRPHRVALILGMAALAATSLEAAEIDHPTDETTNSVRVMNNYVAQVRVYAEDSQGRLHKGGPRGVSSTRETGILTGFGDRSGRF